MVSIEGTFVMETETRTHPTCSAPPGPYLYVDLANRTLWSTATQRLPIVGPTLVWDAVTVTDPGAACGKWDAVHNVTDDQLVWGYGDGSFSWSLHRVGPVVGVGGTKLLPGHHVGPWAVGNGNRTHPNHGNLTITNRGPFAVQETSGWPPAGNLTLWLPPQRVGSTPTGSSRVAPS